MRQGRETRARFRQQARAVQYFRGATGAEGSKQHEEAAEKMSAIDDRRRDERRSPGRRTQDLIRQERQARLLRLEDPAAIAAWELEAERMDRARQWRTARLIEIVRTLR